MNDIVELRRHLFDTLAALKDKTSPMDIDRARAVQEVAQVIINSAKAEIDLVRVSGCELGSGFFSSNGKQPPALEQGSHHGKSKISAVPGGRVITHHLGD